METKPFDENELILEIAVKFIVLIVGDVVEVAAEEPGGRVETSTYKPVTLATAFTFVSQPHQFMNRNPFQKTFDTFYREKFVCFF